MHRLFAATVALALLFGVGQAALAAESAESAPGEQTPEIRPFSSAHFGLVGTVKVDGVTVDVLGEGDLAPPDRQKSSFKFGPLTAEVIMADNAVFTRTRFDPRWSRQPSPEPITIGPISASEATQLAKDTRLVGNERVGDVATQHYTSSLDLQPLIGPLLPEISDRDARAALATLKGTVDVWVGSDDRMVRQERMILTATLPSIEPGGDPMPGAIDLTIAYSKLNQPVQIAAPARTDTSPLLTPRPDVAPVTGPAGSSTTGAPPPGPGAPATPGRPSTGGPAPAQAPAQIPRR
jgi:hypothetical protein